MRNVTKRGDSYFIRISAGYDVNGKQVRKTMTWTPDYGMSARQIEKELDRQIVMFEERVKTGFILDGSTRFADFAVRFMETKELSPKCRERYINLLERINAEIGHIKIAKLQPHHLQELYKKLRTITSKQTKEPLSDKTVLHHHRLISSILTQATREQLIPRNVADRQFMDAPKVAKKEPKFLDDKQAQYVVSLLVNYDDIRVKTAALLLIYSGIRRGELCGLEWSDIDFANCILRVCCATQYVRGAGLLTKEPKNDSSKRTIKLPREVFALLKEYKNWQARERFASGDKWSDTLAVKFAEGSGYKERTIKNERIFTTEFGGLISPDTINFWIERFRKQYDLPKFTPHSLRHTNVTLQIAAGVSLRTVAARAGHAQTSTTANIYAHAIKSADEAASDVLDDILSPKKYSV